MTPKRVQRIIGIEAAILTVIWLVIWLASGSVSYILLGGLAFLGVLQGVWMNVGRKDRAEMPELQIERKLREVYEIYFQDDDYVGITAVLELERGIDAALRNKSPKPAPVSMPVAPPTVVCSPVHWQGWQGPTRCFICHGTDRSHCMLLKPTSSGGDHV
jgi:hypothetical protein